MSATVEKLADESIIIVTIDGHLDAEIARDIYHQIAELTEELEPPIYRITDVRKMEITFIELMGVIKEASKNTPGTTTDERITHMFVGKDKFAMIARDVMRRINPDNHPMMDSIEEALTYIRWKSEQDTEDVNSDTINVNPEA